MTDADRLAALLIALAEASVVPEKVYFNDNLVEHGRVILDALHRGGYTVTLDPRPEVCTYRGCGKPKADPIHPGPDERMGGGRHVYRNDGRPRPAPDAALRAERDALAEDEQSAWESYEALREAAQMLAYLWDAETINGSPVRDHFYDDDPLTSDVPRIIAALAPADREEES